jgi:hypothetical protein
MQSKLKSVLARIGMVIISTALVLLIVELSLRFYFLNFGTLSDRIMYVYSPAEILEASPSFVGLPFVGFGPSSRGSGHNRLGFRSHEVEILKPEGTFRIAATGGSTTYGSGVGPDQTWPAQLERILRDEYGYSNVEVINTASTAYTTWNSLTNFAFRVVDLQPDLLIIYHATNDAKARLTAPECYTGETPIRGLYDGMWRTQGPDLGPSTIYRFLAIGRGWLPNPNDLNNWILPVEASIGGCPTTLPEQELLERNPPIFFERNLRNLVALARANGTEVMISTWAYYPPLIVKDYWETAFDEMNAVNTRVATDLDTLYYDLMGSLPENADYWYEDGEHQTVAGTEEQARRYAAYLVESGVLPAENP